MKTFLGTVHFLLLCLDGVMGQNVDAKTRIRTFKKPLDIETFHNFSNVGTKLKMHNPTLFITPSGNHFKSAVDGNQQLDSTIFEIWDPEVNKLVVIGKNLST